MTVDLVVMRHATAEPFGPSDSDRRLTEAGCAQARECGAWLAEQVGADPGFAQVLVSAAVRTRETWALVAEAAGWASDTARFDEALYHAGPEEVLEMLRGLEGPGPTLLIGHNPTVATVASLIHDGLGEPAAMQQLARGYSPATAACFAAPEQEWDWGTARLLAVRPG